MLKYFQPIRHDNLVLSVDKVVNDYYISNPQKREILKSMLEIITLKYACELSHWQSFKIGTFHENITIKFKDGESFWVGLGLNEAKTNWGRVRIEFNPNKVALHSAFREVLALLNTSSRAMHTAVTRFDLAIDLPVLRENVFLVKDNRLYLERRHGQEWTQYLGKKSNIGHVKLYNKQIESKLSHPLTRLELTLDPYAFYEDINMPTVYFIKDLQMTFDDMKLTDTERSILEAILNGHIKLERLGRKERKKMENIIKNYVEYITITQEDYSEIIRQVKAYKEYPTVPLDKQNLDLDSPVVVQDNGDKFMEIKNTLGLPFTNAGCFA